MPGFTRHGFEVWRSTAQAFTVDEYGKANQYECGASEKNIRLRVGEESIALPGKCANSGDQHEDGRIKRKLCRLAFGHQVGGDDEQGHCGDQLVGGAEDRPNFLPAFCRADELASKTTAPVVMYLFSNTGTFRPNDSCTINRVMRT